MSKSESESERERANERAGGREMKVEGKKRERLRERERVMCASSHLCGVWFNLHPLGLESARVIERISAIGSEFCTRV